MDFFKSLYGLPQGELYVYPVGKAQPHDIGVIFLMLEGGCPFWELVQLHIKKVYGILAVKIT